MNLQDLYNKKIASKTIAYDANQVEVIQKLDDLKTKLEKNSMISGFRKIFQGLNILQSESSELKGIYLYSDVGRGKTMLMDLFFNNVNVDLKKKYRVHFHLFMRDIHHYMHTYRAEEQQLNTNDLIDNIVAAHFGKYKLICLDEFLVNDVADAVILARIIAALLKYQIVLITTSNLHPDNLYKNGLQRALFLPTIKLLKDNLDVVNLNGKIDYRAQMLIQMSCYYSPNNQSNLELISNLFARLNSINGDKTTKTHITILDRQINCLQAGENIIWFEFDAICKSARSQNDYIEIAELYQTVIISGVSLLTDKVLDVVRRFINLIDVFYDFKVNLILCSDFELEKLYQGEVVRFEFARTISRIKEMQTESYFKTAHML